jgi:hypothetical protein
MAGLNFSTHYTELGDEQLELEFKSICKSKKRLFKIIKNLCNKTISCDQIQYKTHLDKIRQEFIDVNVRLDEIETRKVDLIEENRDQQIEECEQLYATFLSKIISDKQVNIPNITPMNYSVPVLHIPPFDGSVERWSEFKALYDSAVHNNNQISTLHKFQQLKGLLIDQASELLVNIPLLEKNYQVAYNHVNDRYNNSPRTANHYLNSIMYAPDLSTVSAETIQTFLCRYRNAIRGLKQIVIPDLADYTFAQIILAKLEVNTRTQFESSIPDNEFTTVDKLTNFLTTKLRILETINARESVTTECKQEKVVRRASVTNSRSSTPTRQPNLEYSTTYKPKLSYAQATASPPKSRKTSPTRSSVSSSTGSDRFTINPSTQDKQFLCLGCDTMGHRIYTCPYFRSFSVQDRCEHVAYYDLCYACLGAHNRSKCQSTQTCRICGDDRHHTLLHKDPNNNAPLQRKLASARPGSKRPSSINSKLQLPKNE